MRILKISQKRQAHFKSTTHTSSKEYLLNLSLQK
jgi:hypothetical protein